MSTTNYRPQLPRVIVRSFNDEPVVLVAHRLQPDKRRVLVGIATAKRPISLPVSDVFDFDDGQFRALSDAFNRGDRIRLAELYKTLGQNNACNKYQDALRYAHEEKAQIPDTRSAA